MRALTVVVHPALDLPGEWVARCLELDLVTQGRGAPAALRAAAEAVEAVSSESPRPGAADDALADLAGSASSDELSFEGCVAVGLARLARAGAPARRLPASLPPHLEGALAAAGVETLGELRRVVRLVGRLRVSDLAALRAAVAEAGATP